MLEPNDKDREAADAFIKEWGRINTENGRALRPWPDVAYAYGLVAGRAEIAANEPPPWLGYMEGGKVKEWPSEEDWTGSFYFLAFKSEAEANRVRDLLIANTPDWIEGPSQTQNT